MNQAIILQLIVILLYLIGFTYLGVWGHRISKQSVEDYFLANRSFGAVMTIGTFTATLFSAFLYLGMTGAYYSSGFVGALPTTLGNLMFSVVFLIFAKRAWLLGTKFNYVTLGDWASDRYQDKSYGSLVALMQFLWTFPYFALQIIGGGLALQALSQGAIPSFYGALMITAVMLIYTYMSGMRGVVWTDLISAIIFVGVFVIVIVAIIGKSPGGLPEITANIQSSSPNALYREGATGFYQSAMWFSIIMMMAFNILGQPQIFMRIFIARNQRTISAVGLIGCGLIVTVIGLMAALVGVGIKGIDPNIGAAANALPIFVSTNFGPIMSALLLGGILAAIISTTDSVLLAISSVIERNVYEYIRPGKSQKHYFQFSRLVVLISTLVAFIFAMLSPMSILDLGFLTFAGYGTLAIPALFGMYWKRGNAYGAWAGTLVGTFLVFYLMILAGKGSGPINGFHASTWAILADIIVYFAVSLITPASSAEHTKRIFGFMERALPLYNPVPRKKAPDSFTA